ncbi:TPA: hypothetical protein ACH3X1_009958 [Trebouxia sp. C0004]
MLQHLHMLQAQIALHKTGVEACAEGHTLTCMMLQLAVRCCGTALTSTQKAVRCSQLTVDAACHVTGVNGPDKGPKRTRECLMLGISSCVLACSHVHHPHH